MNYYTSHWMLATYRRMIEGRSLLDRSFYPPSRPDSLSVLAGVGKGSDLSLLRRLRCRMACHVKFKGWTPWPRRL